MADTLELHLLRSTGLERIDARPAGAGIYTGMRTFKHERFLWLDAHLARLESNIAMLGWDFELDHGVVRRGLHAAVSAHAGEDARVRLDVLAEGPEDERLVCELRPFTPIPAAFIAEGVGVALTSELRREQPRVKRTAFIEQRKPYPLQGQECFEHIMVAPDGRLLEGTSSNFFGVSGGVLRTSGEDVLEGITRKVFLHLARRANLPVDLNSMHTTELGGLDEAFITSSSRGLVPVCAIEGRAVGSGAPGPVARRLLADYATLCELEPRPARLGNAILSSHTCKIGSTCRGRHLHGCKASQDWDDSGDTSGVLMR